MLNLVLQLAVFLPYPTKINVVATDTGDASLQADNPLLERRHRSNGPDANPPRRVVLAAALHLDGKAQNLEDDDRSEKSDIPIAAHEVFQNDSFKFPVSSFVYARGHREVWKLET